MQFVPLVTRAVISSIDVDAVVCTTSVVLRALVIVNANPLIWTEVKPCPAFAHESTEGVATHLAAASIVGRALVEIVFAARSSESARALAHLRRGIRASSAVETNPVGTLRIVAARFTV
jgi:hypothetical protein